LSKSRFSNILIEKKDSSFNQSVATSGV